MSQERFEKGMNELKNIYSKAPTTTNSKEIFQSIQQEKWKRKRKKSFRVYMPAIAAMIGIFLIGGILVGSLLSEDELSQQTPNVNDEGAGITADNGDNDANENAETEDNTTEENDEEDTSDPSMDKVDRPNQFTRTEYPEGMAEEVTYELYINEELGFSTYINPEMGATISENQDRVTLLTDYLRMEAVKLSEPPAIEETENQLKEAFIQEGFSEINDETRDDMFVNAVSQGVMKKQKEEIMGYYAVIENEADGTMYTFTVEMPVIIQEGVFYPAVQLFVDEMQFH